MAWLRLDASAVAESSTCVHGNVVTWLVCCDLNRRLRTFFQEFKVIVDVVFRYHDGRRFVADRAVGDVQLNYRDYDCENVVMCTMCTSRRFPKFMIMTRMTCCGHPRENVMRMLRGSARRDIHTGGR